MGAPKELRQQVVKAVINKTLCHREAAQRLGVTERTIQNYCRRFLDHGPEGLKDCRTGNYRKLTPIEEAAIVSFKRERPQRSARLIRDRLRLKVSEQAVRDILAKYHLNGRVSLTS